MTEFIALTVLRYRCRTCTKTYSSKAGVRKHYDRCWYNPAARGCKTCVHFEPGGPEYNDTCAVGVDLRGTEVIERETGRVTTSDDGLTWFTGDLGPWNKPGPIVHCDKWEAGS